MVFRHWLTTLRNPRHHCRSLRKSNTAQAATEYAAGSPLAFDIAMTTERELHCFASTGCQSTKNIAARGTLGHLVNQLGYIGRSGVSMHQCRVRLKSSLASRRQWRHTRKHAVLVMGQFAQHDGQSGFIKVLDVVRRNAHAHRAGPVCNLRHLCAQMVKNVLCVNRVMVGDVKQRQGWRSGIAGQSHVRAQLRQHKARRHLPLRMGGMAIGK